MIERGIRFHRPFNIACLREHIRVSQSGHNTRYSLVTTGLDPVVHAEAPRKKSVRSADDIVPKITPVRIH
jgi:hypothetical protein